MQRTVTEPTLATRNSKNQDINEVLETCLSMTCW